MGAFDVIEWPATLKEAPSQSATLGAFVIQFEKTTLAQTVLRYPYGLEAG